MTFELSDRGFKWYEPIETDYGHMVRVYESSAAMRPCLWLTVELDHERGGIKPEKAHAHLTIEQAMALRETLDAAILNHYQLAEEGESA